MRTLVMGCVVASMLFSGCATKPMEMSREQWLANISRTYEGKTREQVIAAAEKLLRLADGDDFQFVHRPDGFDASRRWTSYALLVIVGGTDVWQFRVEDASGGVKATVLVATKAQGTAPMPMLGGGAGGTPLIAGQTAPMENAVTGDALYTLFWARMDYLLGKPVEWMSCLDQRYRLKTKVVSGDDDQLCNSFNMKDKKPTDP